MIDMQNNRIPKNVKKIHLIAICGTAMAALAAMLKDLGYEVTGSDQNVYPPMSTFLEEKGIDTFQGFHGDHITDDVDLVIVGNAVRRENPEAVKVAETGQCFCSMPQALNHFVAKGKKPILITGTHGKTTTSSILAWLLYHAGLDPSFMIGGIVRNFDSNYRLGGGEYIVLEGDEYDTAFFDKGPKFLHYTPHMAVLTSVEFDHADIFRDLDHVISVFDALISKIPSESTLFAFSEDGNVSELTDGRLFQLERYGRNAGSAWQLDDVSIDSPWNCFSVKKEGQPFYSFKSMMPGEHNMMNMLAAIGIAHRLGISKEKIAEGLELFKGAKRRQEIRGEKRGITVIDDFAHHPTAVKETIKAVKNTYPDKRLIAVFEPRTNTSMRNIFQDVYPTVFDDADMVCIRVPSMLEKVPENERFSSSKLAEDLKTRGVDAYLFPDTDKIITFLCGHAVSGDNILVMSNGGFDNIHERLLDAL